MGEENNVKKNTISNGVKISVVDIAKTVPDGPPKKYQMNYPKKDKGAIPQPYLTMFASELLGTALLMFLGCMGCIKNFDEPTPTHHYGGLTFGLTVMLIIQSLGHISGAHLNPAVTLATVFFGMVKPLMAVVYVIAQFVGATLGYGLLKVLVSDKYANEGFCMTTLDPHISVLQGLGIEIVITTVLILICCGVWDKRNETKTDSVPLRFGFAIAAISMAAGPLTGASMNTARSFAPLVFGGSWADQWIFWVGPNVAAVIGCALYKFLFSESDDGNKRESIFLDDVSPQSADKV